MKRGIVLSLASCVLCASVAFAQEAAPAAAPEPPSVSSLESKFDWKEMTDVLVDQYDKDPFGRIAGQMGAAASLLGELNTNDPTQPKQQDVIFSLDEIIGKLEKRKRKMKAGGGPNPNSPLPDSVIAGGPGGQGNMRDPSASSRLWGQLPPKQREQILQSQNEGFPPGYESILSSYYKRLAQENVEDLSASPATQPSSSR